MVPYVAASMHHSEAAYCRIQNNGYSIRLFPLMLVDAATYDTIYLIMHGTRN